jgi:hypothetical protein
MMNTRNIAVRLVAASILMTGLAACQKQDAKEGMGPAEKAGQQLDQAAARAGDELNKAAEEAGKGLQKLGQKIQNESKEAQESAKKE